MQHYIRYTSTPHSQRRDLHNLRRIYPYIWDYRGRVVLALVALVISKVAMVGVPFVLKHIVDHLDISVDQILALPLALLLAYGALRLVSSLFNELRDAVFARVRYHAMLRVSN